ncbi:interleukin-1 receptor type 1 [Clupea harengus]|uniref:Interleukin-1 receptor type 1 n=1 Tax=Clupea harengus TaxID=7950 RepID=A0A8M1K5M5_CLUHA|nr:interleukin-1 receptor type 1 [Clupea harengus]
MAWRRLNVCVGLLLLLLAEPPKAKGDAAPTFQPATLPTSTHTPEKYYACVGHVMVLPCDDAEGQNVTWRREKAPPLGVDGGGVRVMDGALWFLPANSSHSGVYVCKWSDGVQRVMLRVDSGVCPEKTRDRYLDLSADVGRLNCKQDHIFKSDPQAHITWLKDCEPLNSFERTLHIFNVSRQDGGRYTCLLHFSLEGQNYTSASTTEVHIGKHDSEPPSKPQVIGPRNETLVVELANHEMFYCVVGMAVFCGMLLVCVCVSVLIHQWGVVSLVSLANHAMFYCVVGMAVFCGMLLVCVYLCWRRRVDLVLLYRSLCPALHKQCDGKLYDAYVSYPSGNSVSMAMTFALRVLPEVLERNYGYKLFIRGRDDLPGEAVFDIIDEALAKSRRLIIVLDGTPMETHTLNVHAEIIPLTFTHTHGETTDTHTHRDTHTDTHTQCDPEQVCFERTLGQYDALVSSGLKVLIVQTGEEGSTLPPPLLLLTRSKRPLRWHTHSHTHSHSHSHTPSQQRFWKELRYRMPAPQKTVHQNSSAV